VTDAVSPIGAATPATATAGISTDTSRLKSKANLEKAGQQFEAVFTGMMLKSMRQAKLAEPLFDSKALDTFNDMADQKMVQSMAEHMPLGIGKAMTAFLGKSQADLATPAAPTPTIAPPATAPADDSGHLNTSTG
jgi:flagellar protein FlgJ